IRSPYLAIMSSRVQCTASRSSGRKLLLSWVWTPSTKVGSTASTPGGIFRSMRPAYAGSRNRDQRSGGYTTWASASKTLRPLRNLAPSLLSPRPASYRANGRRPPDSADWQHTRDEGDLMVNSASSAKTAVREHARQLIEVLDEIGDDVLRKEKEIIAIMQSLLDVPGIDPVLANPSAAAAGGPFSTGWIYYDCDLRVTRGIIDAGFVQRPHNHGTWNILGVYHGAMHY